MAAPDAVGSVAVARSEVRKSLERLDYHLARGKKGAKGVRREIAYLDALHRQTVRLSGVAGGVAFQAKPIASFGNKAAEALATGNNRTIGRMKSSILADFSADGLDPVRRFTLDNPQTPWLWVANASACPTCLSEHGKYRTGLFIPKHPSCLCIPQPAKEAVDAGVTELSQSQIKSAIQEWGLPRYQRLMAKHDNGLLDWNDIVNAENINTHQQGLGKFLEHLNKQEVVTGYTAPLSSAELAATPPYGGVPKVVDQAKAPKAPKGTQSELRSAAFPEDRAIRIDTWTEDLGKHSEDWWLAMTEDERQAVREYSRSFYDWENQYRLRKATGQPHDEILDAIRHTRPTGWDDDRCLEFSRLLESGMKKGESPGPQLTYRKMSRGSDTVDEFVQQLDSALVTGAPVDYVPYASTSVNPGFSLRSYDDVYFEFISKNGRYLGNNSAYVHEREWLINAGTEFRVVGKKQVKFVSQSEQDLKASLFHHQNSTGRHLGNSVVSMDSLTLDYIAKTEGKRTTEGLMEHIAKFLETADDTQLKEASQRFLFREQTVYQMEELGL